LRLTFNRLTEIAMYWSVWDQKSIHKSNGRLMRLNFYKVERFWMAVVNRKKRNYLARHDKRKWVMKQGNQNRCQVAGKCALRPSRLVRWFSPWLVDKTIRISSDWLQLTSILSHFSQLQNSTSRNSNTETVFEGQSKTTSEWFKYN